MRELDALVAGNDVLAQLAEAVKEGDHGLVKPPVLEHPRDRKVTRAPSEPFRIVSNSKPSTGVRKMLLTARMLSCPR